MNDIIAIYLKWTFMVSAILYGSIFFVFIVPAIKSTRKIIWSDWLGLNYDPFSYLEEYKVVCLLRGESLVFYWICRGIFKFLMFSLAVCFLMIFV